MAALNMTNPAFRKVRAKVTRAEQNIQDFQLGLGSFFDSKPYEVAVKDDPQRGNRVFYLSKIDEPPDTLAAIASDIIQNLRSSLDTLAYQLVLASRGGTKPEWRVYFPIAGSAADYKGTRRGCIKGVGQSIIDASDATEPYKGGKGHALWQLQQIANADKHELLIGAGSFSRNVDVSGSLMHAMRTMGFDIKIPPIRFRPADQKLPLKLGDELMIEPLDLEVGKHCRLAFDVSINAPGVIECEPALKTLKDLTNLVGSIVDEFERFFP